MQTRTYIRAVPCYEPALMRSVARKIFSALTDLTDWLAQPDPARLVVVKPNWIQECHQVMREVWEPVITHPELVLAVVEYVASMMKGGGTICVCDAPQTYANFESILGRGGFRQRLEQLRGRFPKVAVEVLDLRRERWIVKDDVIVARIPNEPDPRGYVRVDLGRYSMLYGHRGEGRYYGADYDSAEVNSHHRGDKHEYLLAGTPLQCDLFINMPKLKTHKKTGLTCALKNLVGINGDKNWLPHFTQGTPAEGGDEFSEATLRSRVEANLKRLGQRLALRIPGVGPALYRYGRRLAMPVFGNSHLSIRSGDWHGNDTCWRMTMDLNRALFYAASDGTIMSAMHPRRYIVIVDGVIGGEGNGPLCPDPVASGVIIVGQDPAAVDAVAARLMGFDIGNLPMVKEAFSAHALPITRLSLESVKVLDERIGAEEALLEIRPAVTNGFRPHFGWPKLNPLRC